MADSNSYYDNSHP